MPMATMAIIIMSINRVIDPLKLKTLVSLLVFLSKRERFMIRKESLGNNILS